MRTFFFFIVLAYYFFFLLLLTKSFCRNISLFFIIFYFSPPVLWFTFSFQNFFPSLNPPSPPKKKTRACFGITHICYSILLLHWRKLNDMNDSLSLEHRCLLPWLSESVMHYSPTRGDNKMSPKPSNGESTHKKKKRCNNRNEMHGLVSNLLQQSVTYLYSKPTRTKAWTFNRLVLKVINL